MHAVAYALFGCSATGSFNSTNYFFNHETKQRYYTPEPALVPAFNKWCAEQHQDPRLDASFMSFRKAMGINPPTPCMEVTVNFLRNDNEYISITRSHTILGKTTIDVDGELGNQIDIDELFPPREVFMSSVFLGYFAAQSNVDRRSIVRQTMDMNIDEHWNRFIENKDRADQLDALYIQEGTINAAKKKLKENMSDLEEKKQFLQQQLEIYRAATTNNFDQTQLEVLQTAVAQAKEEVETLLQMHSLYNQFVDTQDRLGEIQERLDESKYLTGKLCTSCRREVQQILSAETGDLLREKESLQIKLAALGTATPVQDSTIAAARSRHEELSQQLEALQETERATYRLVEMLSSNPEHKFSEENTLKLIEEIGISWGLLKFDLDTYKEFEQYLNEVAITSANIADPAITFELSKPTKAGKTKECFDILYWNVLLEALSTSETILANEALAIRIQNMAGIDTPVFVDCVEAIDHAYQGRGLGQRILFVANPVTSLEGMNIDA